LKIKSTLLVQDVISKKEKGGKEVREQDSTDKEDPKISKIQWWKFE